MPRCAGCQSLERHRIFRIMFDRLGPEGFSGWKAIQFSPDATVDPSWFGAHELSVYGEPGGLDIQAIDRPDAAYDIVICSHVIEHVGDERKALHELLRIVKPDGMLYLSVGSSCNICIAFRTRPDERRCVPPCTMRSYFRAASTILPPSKMLCETGFSTYTCLPACMAQIDVSACQ